jgi:hypothetical protein
MTAYTYHGKTSSANRNSGRIPKLSERGCHKLKRIVSKNRGTTAAKVTSELNIHLEDHFHKNRSFTNPISMVEL